jgi:hypothetical protein
MHPRCGACLHGWAVRDPPSCRGQAVPDPPARQGREPRVRRWARCRVERQRGRCVPRLLPRRWRGGRGSASPLHAVVARHRCNLCVRWWRIPPPSGRGQAVPDPPAREGRGMTPSPGYGCRSRRGWAPAVRPGLKPRAESPSPLKGAVRRPGGRVDRLGAGAGGISRLQPAWGLSPAVNGRAIVDTAALLIGAACRARRVGHVASPRRWCGGRGSASPLQRGTHQRLRLPSSLWLPRPHGVGAGALRSGGGTGWFGFRHHLTAEPDRLRASRVVGSEAWPGFIGNRGPETGYRALERVHRLRCRPRAAGRMVGEESR